ncbi:MAG: UDP-N-acetylmuramoyl-L-alanyl-D-glutamate--2,6-diaminopimelate ligase [Alphaproteobacteria bacterium]|nr:UDP-N-acetylmuramoyl-L-alanyl-D-glutamate--2,6-diaminopimelate ligase [Alphaproteobacteria bacterium]
MQYGQYEFSGFDFDSRRVKPGWLFVDAFGGRFIKSAVDSGAKIIVCKEGDANPADYPGVRFIFNENPARFFAQEIVAAQIPGMPKNMLGITGTNGKTSIADFVRQMLFHAGHVAASIGTLGIVQNDNPAAPLANTTPDVITLHRILADLADKTDYCVMEMSSHGLEQSRVAAVPVKVAGFTNLTRDHLDYHLTMENYFASKALLFSDNLVAGGTAVLNADSDWYDRFAQAAAGKNIVSYGYKGKDVRLIKSTAAANGQDLQIEFFGRKHDVSIPLAGDFQGMNVLCAMAMVAAATGDYEAAPQLAGQIKGASGRLELVGTKLGKAAVYVDYAHTPDALEKALSALRPYTSGRLAVVFGCGGNRDAGKRPIMGRLAAGLADMVYVTDDNPRKENADEIRAQVMAGCPDARNIGDRKKAIQAAIQDLQAGDVLLIAGKGHETGQIVGSEVLPFSDQETAKEFL